MNPSPRCGPLAPTRLGGLYVATGHQATLGAVRALRVGVPIADQGAYRWDSPLSPSLLDLNPPDHTRVRRLVAQAFTPRAIARLRERAQTVADELLDAMARKDGPVDLIADYAAPLPVTLICEMLGVPADYHDCFRRWGDTAALSLELVDAGQQVAIDRAANELDAYFAGHFARRRHEPADDLLAALVAARDGGDRLPQKELVATCILLLVAGFETTINLIGNGTLALLDDHGQREAFTADPRGLAPNAVEELLRYDSPVQLTSRHAEEDTEVAGVTVRKGEHVLCLLGAGNRDPTFSPTPTASTCLAPMPASTCRSPRAPTTAWARRWPGWRGRSRSRRCSSASPTSGWPRRPAAAPPWCCAASRRCRWCRPAPAWRHDLQVGAPHSSQECDTALRPRIVG